jgi:hypothetical protein
MHVDPNAAGEPTALLQMRMIEPWYDTYIRNRLYCLNQLLQGIKTCGVSWIQSLLGIGLGFVLGFGLRIPPKILSCMSLADASLSRKI